MQLRTGLGRTWPTRTKAWNVSVTCDVLGNPSRRDRKALAKSYSGHHAKCEVNDEPRRVVSGQCLLTMLSPFATEGVGRAGWAGAIGFVWPTASVHCVSWAQLLGGAELVVVSRVSSSQKTSSRLWSQDEPFHLGTRFYQAT